MYSISLFLGSATVLECVQVNGTEIQSKIKAMAEIDLFLFPSLSKSLQGLEVPLMCGRKVV